MNQFEKLKEEIAAAQAAIFEPINSLISEADDDAQKYYGKGVRSAGNRLKKKMQEIRKAIKHPEVKAKMTSIQNSAKGLRESLIEEAKTK
jgi:hypothetical protein